MGSAKIERRCFGLFIIEILLLSLVGAVLVISPGRVQAQGSGTLPLVAIHVSEYTQAKWPYTSWKYFQMYSIIEESLRSDGTPFVEITDAQIEGGNLLTASGSPKYPIFISLAAECISSLEAQRIKEYVQAGGFAYVGSSSWTRNQDGTPYAYVTPCGVTVVADSTWGPSYVATNTLDGDSSTQWFMENDKYSGSTGLPINGPINITFTFDNVYEINKIELVQTHWSGNNYKTKDYEIWVSTDGTAWSKVAQDTLPNTDSVAEQTSFSPTNAKKVKIVITSVWVSQTANTGGLADFKAFTTGGATLPVPVPPPKYTFWLWQEMGLDSLPTYDDAASPYFGGVDRWNSWSSIGISGRGVLVESTVDNRLVNDVPKGVRLLWDSPSNYDVRPGDGSTHYAWATISTGATVLATFESTEPNLAKAANGYKNIPLIAYNSYGAGYFIYHSELGIPLAYGSWGPDTFTYAFFRRAIEWAFEANSVPLVRLAAWQYPMKAAFIIRTDCDGGISDMLDYVAIDQARNVHGEYYVVTNDAASSVTYPASVLNQAISEGAIIGSHNSYHTGPDAQSYTDAVNNIVGSLDQLQAWIGFRPEIWVSPNYDAIKEQSLQIISSCGLVTAGEQGFGPFPHFAMSMETPGVHYGFVELPVLEYFSDIQADYQPILHCFSFYTTNCNDPDGTMSKAIDLAYGLGGLIDIYSHFRPGNLQRRAFYIDYTQTKPNVWFTNSQDIYNWELKRNQVSIVPTYEHGSVDKIDVAVSGPVDAGPYAVDIKIPWSYQTIQVMVNGVAVSDYEVSADGVKVSCQSPSQVEYL